MQKALVCVGEQGAEELCLATAIGEEVWGKGLGEFATSFRSGQAKTLFWIQWFWEVGLEKGSVPTQTLICKWMLGGWKM